MERLIDANRLLSFIEYDAKIIMPEKHTAQDIITMIKAAPTITAPPNDPLTLEELREMDGEPMWVVPLIPVHEHEDMEPRWAIVRARRFQDDGDGYGYLWVAYRRKPEEG